MLKRHINFLIKLKINNKNLQSINLFYHYLYGKRNELPLIGK